MQKKIVITGGPGTGKSTVIAELFKRNYDCMEEISRQITLEAQRQGIAQLFLSDPLLFSDKLMEGRMQQYKAACELTSDLVFFDRGIPDVHAYMDFANQEYPEKYVVNSVMHKYTKVFIMPPWKDIYICDNERYEDFEQALKIHTFLHRTYHELGYEIIEVPTGTVAARTDFILGNI